MRTVVAFAPGRVNLIGEHTDHQGGFALPFAVDLGITLAADPRPGPEVTLTTAAPVDPGWDRYPRAIVDLLREEGVPVPGFTGRYESTLPVGGGLSSSAALVVATGLAACELARRPVEDRVWLADLCRLAETRATGVRCGIMDPYAVLHGVSGRGLLLDCRGGEHAEVDLRTDRIAYLVADSGVRRSLEGVQYNLRRKECEAAARILGQHDPRIRDLRDARIEDLEAVEIPPPLDRRARHVVTENLRVHEAADALGRDSPETLGVLMARSHESLRRDFEVSCAELDALVSIAAGLPGVFGSRLTGAGFGGSTITAVRREDAGLTAKSLARLGRMRTGHETVVREVRPSPGAVASFYPMP